MDKAEENIIQRDIENEMRTAYIDYAMSVIVAQIFLLFQTLEMD